MVVSSELAVADLLRCFFSECERSFRFLEQSHGFNYISGLVDYRDNYKVIKPYHNQNIGGRFLALTRYEFQDRAIELLFGEEHFFLEGYVYYDPVQRFEFSEVLAAAKKDDRAIAGEWGLTDPDMIAKTVRKIAGALQGNLDYYLKPDEKLLNRAGIIRSKRIEQVVRKHFQNQIKDACIHAAKAFLKKDYTQVISLLSPLERYLAAGDLKKLRLAQRYIQA